MVKLLSSDKLNCMKFTLNYVNNAGITEFTEFNVKQVVNRLAHLPRVQAPVHTVNMMNGVPGVHHKRRPQDMTKIHKIH